MQAAVEREKPKLPPAASRWPAVVLVLYWCLLVYLVHTPMRGIHLPTHSQSDKVVHFLLYGGLAFWLALAADAICGVPPRHAARWRRGMLILLAVAVQGFADEWTQPLTGRTYDLIDWASDLLGAAVCLGLYFTWRAKQFAAA